MFQRYMKKIKMEFSALSNRMLKNTKKSIYSQIMIQTHRCNEQNTDMHEYVLRGLNET